MSTAAVAEPTPEQTTEALLRALAEDDWAEFTRRHEAGEEVWDTTEMTKLYEVQGFMAPYVVVRRRRDGVRGVLIFSHRPRWYFGWQEDV